MKTVMMMVGAMEMAELEEGEVEGRAPMTKVTERTELILSSVLTEGSLRLKKMEKVDHWQTCKN